MPEEGACPLGLGFESYWDDTNTQFFPNTDEHEKVIRRRRKSLAEKLSEEQRQVCDVCERMCVCASACVSLWLSLRMRVLPKEGACCV